MPNKKEKLFSIIVNDVKKLKGFVDIVDRSGKDFIPGWSDIDISLIFKKINYDLLKKLRNLFKKWLKLGIKIDLFILPEYDTPNLPFHFHGGYQLSYLGELGKSKSTFGKYPLKHPYSHDKAFLAIDCYRTMSLKIQEIRRTILTGKVMLYSRVLSLKARETMHILKKAKTVMKMANQIIQYTNKEPLKEIEDFMNFYNHIRLKWGSLRNNREALIKAEIKTINSVERVFEKICKKYLPIIKLKKF